MTHRQTLKALGALLLSLCAGLAGAQDSYPSKPITMVVPFPPGGVADVVGRPVAEAMARHLNQSVVVINRAGAGGGIGMAQVAKAAPDGYTVLMALSSLVVRADSPWKTYQEFIAYARSNPSKITFGSSGNYGTMHVPMEQLKASTNTFMLHVPYTGAGPAILGLLSGQVEAVATGPASAVGQIKAGKLRALAHWGEGRLPLLPDVPSFKELGVNIGYSQWAGIFVPAGTPPAVVNKLREAAQFAARDEKTVQAMTTAGTSFQFQDAPAFDAFVKEDAKAMAGVVRRIGKVN